MRRQANGGPIPRQPDAEGGCVFNHRLATVWAVTNFLRSRHNLTGDNQLMVSITNALQRISHINHVELPPLRRRHDDDNGDLRLRYLVNDLSEDTWRQQLQRREKKRARDLAVRDIYQMAVDTAGDAFMQLLEGNATPEETDRVLTALRSYTNEHLHKIAVQYKQVVNKW